MILYNKENHNYLEVIEFLNLQRLSHSNNQVNLSGEVQNQYKRQDVIEEEIWHCEKISCQIKIHGL